MTGIGIAGEAGETFHDALEAGLRRVASTELLLVVSDFDGTLAPIVDHPAAVQADAAAVAALRALAEIPGTRVAVLSGRALSVLREHLGHAGLVLVGSHGAELELGEPNGGRERGAADGALRGLLDEVSRELDDLAAEYEGSLVERKPTGVAFHYRKVDAASKAEAAARATDIADDRDALRVQPGHEVVELVTGDVNKGDAVDVLRESLGATATVFVGDDRTDEHAFARLGPSDLAVKVGPGRTCATVRIASQADVAPLFQRLEGLRRR